jgi:hypothetical protein
VLLEVGTFLMDEVVGVHCPMVRGWGERECNRG